MCAESDLSQAAREFGERAATELEISCAAFPMIARQWAAAFDAEGAATTKKRLNSKLAFDRAYRNWRRATRELDVAGELHFGSERWTWVAADLASNAIPLVRGR